RAALPRLVATKVGSRDEAGTLSTGWDTGTWHRMSIPDGSDRSRESARVDVPRDWQAHIDRGRVVLEQPGGQDSARIDLVASGRFDHGAERTPVLVLAALEEQARGFRNADVEAMEVEVDRARIDWSYEYAGTRRARRHWAVFHGEDAVVHISCIDARDSVCDAIADSVRGGKR